MMNEKERQEFLMDMRESMKLEAECEMYAPIDPPYNEEENSYTEYCDVNSPRHYQKGGLEVIYIIDNFTPDPYSAYMANVIKYVLRHLDKGTPKKDLRKAQWYLNRMIEEYDA